MEWWAIIALTFFTAVLYVAGGIVTYLVCRIYCDEKGSAYYNANSGAFIWPLWIIICIISVAFWFYIDVLDALYEIAYSRMVRLRNFADNKRMGRKRAGNKIKDRRWKEVG
jgi:hypothetical protein